MAIPLHPDCLSKDAVLVEAPTPAATGVLDKPDLDLSRLPSLQPEANFGAGERTPSKKLGGGSYRLPPLLHAWHPRNAEQHITCTAFCAR